PEPLGLVRQERFSPPACTYDGVMSSDNMMSVTWVPLPLAPSRGAPPDRSSHAAASPPQRAFPSRAILSNCYSQVRTAVLCGARSARTSDRRSEGFIPVHSKE